jgi:phosphate transport system permease protein
MEDGRETSELGRKVAETLFVGLVSFCAVAAMIPLVLVLGYIFWNGGGALNWEFFTNLPVPVGETGGGMANAMAGTLILIAIASGVGLPVGIFGGIWLAYYGKGKKGFMVRYAADVLSSIPSIVVGIFAYVLLVATLKHFSAIAGGFALGIIMVPTITRNTEEIIRLVPRGLYEAGLALGLSEHKVILRVVLHTAWSGVFTGVMLAVARVAGETAPLIFTAFNSPYWNWRLDQPMASLTVQIYNYAISPFAEWHAQAWAGSLVLVISVLSITLLVRKFSRRISYG